MRAMQVTALGQPLEMREIDRPTPERHEVLVRVHTCGLNFGDTLIVKGTYQEKPQLPATIGMEMCGTIEAIGADAPAVAGALSPRLRARRPTRGPGR